MQKNSGKQGKPKGLPVAIDIERFALASMMCNGDHLAAALAKLGTDDFSREDHKRYFRVIAELDRRGEAVDKATVANLLDSRGELESPYDLASIDDGIPDAPNIDGYIRILKKKSDLRRLATRGQALCSEALLEIDDPAVLAARMRQDLDAMQSASGGSSEEEEQAEAGAQAFPEIAWRGVFADYRDAMKGTTEASDVFHFATFWAAVAVIAGRRVWMDAGDIVYPNVYLACFGPSGDKKTTAARRIFKCGLLGDHPLVKVAHGVGSTEGLADSVGEAETGAYLFFWEEFASFLQRARWTGSTLLDFFTQIFDCPDEYDSPYRKNSVHLKQPTPTILTATTPEWFWRHARAEDFFGGFMNRPLFFTGKKKPSLPNPAEIDGKKIHAIKEHLKIVASNLPQCARWTPAAKKIFTSFYLQFDGQKRSGLLAEAVKRAHVYVRKLAMMYAWLEQTAPHIDADQAEAAIAVVSHAMGDVERLIDLQSAQSKPAGDLEQKFLKWVGNRPGETLRKFHQRMWKYCGDSETFNRIFKSLQVAGQLELRDGKVYLCIR